MLFIVAQCISAQQKQLAHKFVQPPMLISKESLNKSPTLIKFCDKCLNANVQSIGIIKVLKKQDAKIDRLNQRKTG